MLIVLLTWIFSCIIIDFKNPETSEITRFNSIYALKGHEKSERGFISNSCAGWGLNWAFLAWENSRHFSTPSMVSMRHNVWQTSADIPYWRRVTTQMWVVFLIGHAVRQNQQEALPWTGLWLVWNFRARFSDVISQGNQWWRREKTVLFSGYIYPFCLLLFLLSFAISANLKWPTLATNILFSSILVSNSSTYLEVKTWLVTQPCFLATALITTNPVSPSTIPFLLL